MNMICTTNLTRTSSAGVSGMAVARLLDQARRALETDHQIAKRLMVQAADLLDGPDAPVSSVAKGGLTQWQIKRVTAHIERNIARTMPLHELASVANLSASYFGRAFKASTGASPHAYVIQRRIQRARELMAETAEPLAVIAVDCGLADQSHLCRTFARIVGMSPQRWRRAHGTADRFPPGRSCAVAET